MKALKVWYHPGGDGNSFRTVQDKLDERRSLMDFSADPTGASSSSTAITSWINTLMSSGQRGYVPAGTYQITTTVDITCAADIDIECADGAIFVGTNTDTDMFLFDGDGNRTSLRWCGGKIDASERGFVVSTDSGTAMTLDFLDRYHIERVFFYGGEDYDTGDSDSGIAATECHGAVITGCTFQGFSDAGVYIGGTAGAAALADRDTRIYGNFFNSCNVGLTIKRGSPRNLICGNNFDYCGVGYAELEAANPTLPARESIVANNTFTHTETRAVELRFSNGSIVIGNQFIDWGYELDGTTPASQARGIVCLGVKGAAITGNTFKLVDWAATGSTAAMRFAEHTIDSTTRQSTGNVFSNNNMVGLDVGVLESNSSSGNHGSNLFDTVTTPYTLASGSTSKYDTVLSDGTRTVRSSTYIGGTQDLNGAGAVDVVNRVTKWGTTGAQAGTLADGVEGQEKIIFMDADGGDGTLTPSNFGNGTTITFNDVGDCVHLVFINSDWWVVANQGCTVA